MINHLSHSDRLFTVDDLKGNNYYTRTTKLGNKYRVRKKINGQIILLFSYAGLKCKQFQNPYWPTEKQIYKTKDPEIIQVYEEIDGYNRKNSNVW